MSFCTDIPQFYCLMRAEYAYNMESHRGEFIDVLVFGADSVFGRAVGFDVLSDCGVQFARLPVSALVHKKDAPDIPLDDLQLWNNFSYSFEAHEYLAIRNLRCETILKDRIWYPGEYLFTFSWMGNNYAEDPGEGGFKRAHMLKLDNGCFALQPNNRIKWYEPSFVTKPFPEHPDFKTNDNKWICERKDKWCTEDSDSYLYDIVTKEQQKRSS